MYGGKKQTTKNGREMWLRNTNSFKDAWSRKNKGEKMYVVYMTW